MISYNQEIFLFTEELVDMSNVTEEDFVNSVVVPQDAHDIFHANEGLWYCGWNFDANASSSQFDYDYTYMGDITRVVIE